MRLSIKHTFALSLVLFGVLYLNVDFRLNTGLINEIKDSSDLYLSHEGEILRLTTNSKEQFLVWQSLDQYPKELKEYLIHAEDQQYYRHPGVNPFAIVDALIQWGIKGSRLRGASTITMQLARLHYGIHTQSIFGKVNQMLAALYIEASLSKSQILEAYLNLAPMGRNIQGFETASLIYFHRTSKKLAPEEILLLVSFPQNPALIKHSKKTTVDDYHINRAEKLLKVLKNDQIVKTDRAFHFNDVEILPIEALPFQAPHYIDQLIASKKYKGIVQTNLKIKIQNSLERLLDLYVGKKNRKGIKNAAFAVYNWKENQLVAISGSANFFNNEIHGQVNGTLSKRSPGSSLKPFAYALGLDQGIIHPELVIHDAPSMYKLPQNYDKGFLGPISVSKALNLSRNVPAVMLSAQLEGPSFHSFLKMTGEDDLKPQSFYGHTLVLGTKEMSLQRILNLYNALARNGVYLPLNLVGDKNDNEESGVQIFSKEAAVLVKDMLGKTPRPIFNGNQYQKEPDHIYWKTGTSWGYRDAWTFGIQGEYVLGVWVGNFTSIESEHFVGAESAAPLFFNLLNGLPKKKRRVLNLWHQYASRLVETKVCSHSGMHPSKHCPSQKVATIISGVSPTKKCQIHRPVLISKASKKRSCLQSHEETETKVFEFWPSHVEQLYERIGLFLKGPPEYTKECRLVLGIENQGLAPRIIYPKRNNKFILSRKMNRGDFVLKASAESGVKDLYWYSKNKFLGKSRPDQPISVALTAGAHTIRVIDGLGRSESRKIFVEYK